MVTAEEVIFNYLELITDGLVINFAVASVCKQM